MSSPILRLVAQRILLGIVLLLAVSVLIFDGTQILHGDVDQGILGQRKGTQILRIREEISWNS